MDATSSFENIETKFLKGIGLSIWQASGDPDSNWTRFVYNRWPFKNFGFRRTKGRYRLEKTPDFWNRYREDIDCAVKLGCTSLRVCLAWPRIVPRMGEVDEAAVQRMTDILDYMNERGIEPMVVLHHFVHPGWFDDLGGFEKEENIKHFLDFVELAFQRFGTRAKLWATFNEPTCATTLGWICAMHPPGRLGHFHLAGLVLLNMLKAHVLAYQKIRSLPGSQHVKVGLIHHMIKFIPKGNGPHYALARYCSWWMTYWWGWDLVQQWALTGRFTWDLPLGGGRVIDYQVPGGRPPCDWWGINYYSRPVVTWYMTPSTFSGQRLTDMMYPVYAGGLYQAVKYSSALGIPMYITESGVADKTHKARPKMIDTYLKEVLRLVGDGYDLRGFYYWTLMDNYEWNMGYTIKFGLYSWEPSGSKDRQLKPGSDTLARIYQSLPHDLLALRDHISNCPEIQHVEEDEERINLMVQQRANRLYGTREEARHSTHKKRGHFLPGPWDLVYLMWAPWKIGTQLILAPWRMGYHLFMGPTSGRFTTRLKVSSK